ncbi:MAG: type I polyketide synthase, partial [Deltaproteobacteria bacterium]|nr:type I polyketide synthase [Deltaproteobacteria bacterium]
GHLEAAAGIAGLIKVVLALQHQAIPPRLHFNRPNPHIPWADLPIKVTTQVTPWPAGETPRLAGVSSFGFSGVNAHVVLEEAPPPEFSDTTVDRPVHILTLSAKTEQARDDLVQRYQMFLALHPEVNLADVCFTANTGRTHWQHRLAVVAGTPREAQAKLAAFESSHDSAEVITGQIPGSSKSKLAFLFTGQGAQYVGMGREL